MSAPNAIPYDTNVSNFVSVKLSGKHNYFLWKAQMLCLLKSINVCGILDDTFVGPTDSKPETVAQYDNLVRGWIFGSVCEEVLIEVFYLDSAKAVWEKLQSNYDPPTRFQEDSATKKSDGKTEKEEIDVVSAEANIVVEEGPTKKGEDVDAIHSVVEEGQILTEVIVDEEIFSTENETTNEDSQSNEKKVERKNIFKKKLKSLIIKGDWSDIQPMLEKDRSLVTEAISGDGSTILHIAVGVHRNDIVKKLVYFMFRISARKVIKTRDSDGSTALHIAAIVGNTDAARILVCWDNFYLRMEDYKGDIPLRKAYENMHLDTIAFLLKAVKDFDPKTLSVGSDDNFGVNLIVNAIYAKKIQFSITVYELFS